MLGAVDLDFRLISGDLLISLGVRLEEVLQPMKLLAERLVGAIDKQFDLSIRMARVAQYAARTHRSVCVSSSC